MILYCLRFRVCHFLFEAFVNYCCSLSVHVHFWWVTYRYKESLRQCREQEETSFSCGTLVVYTFYIQSLV